MRASHAIPAQNRMIVEGSGTGGSGRIVAPMHGLLLEVRAVVGDEVEAGQTLAVLEAMKMHYEIVADAAGVVSEVMVVAGQQVAADDLLIHIEVAEKN